MITKTIEINKYHWTVKVIIADKEYDANYIAKELSGLHPPVEDMQDAMNLVIDNKLNEAFIHTNHKIRTTMICIGPTSDASEFLDSLVHELCHLKSHINHHIDVDDEEISNVVGNVAKEMYESCKRLLCDSCRNH